MPCMFLFVLFVKVLYWHVGLIFTTINAYHWKTWNFLLSCMNHFKKISKRKCPLSYVHFRCVLCEICFRGKMSWLEVVSMIRCLCLWHQHMCELQACKQKGGFVCCRLLLNRGMRVIQIRPCKLSGSQTLVNSALNYWTRVLWHKWTFSDHFIKNISFFFVVEER